MTSGSPKRQVITCGGCDATWTALGAAHCGCCHRTFAATGLFDYHRTQEGAHGECLDPATVMNRAGDHRLFFRDDMWRGRELDDETRARLWGGGSDVPVPA